MACSSTASRLQASTRTSRPAPPGLSLLRRHPPSRDKAAALPPTPFPCSGPGSDGPPASSCPPLAGAPLRYSWALFATFRRGNSLVALPQGWERSALSGVVPGMPCFPFLKCVQALGWASWPKKTGFKNLALQLKTTTGVQAVVNLYQNCQSERTWLSWSPVLSGGGGKKRETTASTGRARSTAGGWRC